MNRKPKDWFDEYQEERHKRWRVESSISWKCTLCYFAGMVTLPLAYILLSFIKGL